MVSSPVAAGRVSANCPRRRHFTFNKGLQMQAVKIQHAQVAPLEQLNSHLTDGTRQYTQATILTERSGCIIPSAHFLKKGAT